MRESLISLVSGALGGEAVPFAVIGAAALAVHGFPRATADLDLLTIDARALQLEWSSLLPAPVGVEVRTGGSDDPLRGVITFRVDEEVQVELIVGRWKWQMEAIGRSRASLVHGVELPVVALTDLVILKIDAGGILDLRDIDALVEIHGQELLDDVGKGLPEVASIRSSWNHYLRSRVRTQVKPSVTDQ